MNDKLKKLLGAAVLGVLLVVGFGQRDAIARILGRVYGNSLHVEVEPRSSTASRFTLGNDDGYVKGDWEVDGSVYHDGQRYDIVPSTETIAAAGTITADACGGLKRITAAAGVTTSTTNTFTAPSSANKGCRMTVKNVGTNDIILDANALFPVTAASSLTLSEGGSIEVTSDGSFWRKGWWTEY